MIGRILGIIGIVFGSVVCGALAYAVALFVLNTALDWFNRAAHYWLDIKSKSQQIKLDSVRRLMPDENTRQGVVFDGKDYRNLDTGQVFSMLEEKYFDPMMWKIDKVQQTLLAMKGTNLQREQIQELVDEPQNVPLLQSNTLGTLIDKYKFQPRLQNILIGEYVDNGDVHPLVMDVPQSVHAILVGSSGLGKSTLLECIALQLATIDSVELCAVDYGSGTFDGLESRMMYQVADTPELAIAMFRTLIGLANERKEKYKQFDRVRSLAQYNAKSGENLPFIACMVDETGALLDQSNTKLPLVELARMGRKYGIGLFLGSTDLKASTLPTEARGNCQFRLSFWMEPGLSRSMFNSDIASELSGKGEIVCKRPGVVGFTKGRTPIVTEADYCILPGKDKNQEVLIPSIREEGLPEEEKIWKLKEAGYSNRQIEIEVYGYAGGDAYERVKEVLSGT